MSMNCIYFRLLCLVKKWGYLGKNGLLRSNRDLFGGYIVKCFLKIFLFVSFFG